MCYMHLPHPVELNPGTVCNTWYLWRIQKLSERKCTSVCGMSAEFLGISNTQLQAETEIPTPPASFYTLLLSSEFIFFFFPLFHRFSLLLLMWLASTKKTTLECHRHKKALNIPECSQTLKPQNQDTSAWWEKVWTMTPFVLWFSLFVFIWV